MLNPVGTNFPIADFRDAASAADNLNLPDVAYNSLREEYLVVWHGAMRATGYNIYARVVSASGVLSPTVFALCEATGDQYRPSIVYDAQAEQYWAVWEDGRSGGAEQVYARRLSSLGTPSGAKIVVTTSTNVATDPRLACGVGRCVIVWAETYTETQEVYARAYDATGNALTPPVRVSAAGSIASEPDVAYNSTADQYLVVWTEEHSGTGLDVKAQALNSSLSPIGAAVSVCAAPGDQDRARVAYDGGPSKRYCVVWQDKRSGTSWDVYAQLLSGAGQLQGASLAVYTGDLDDGNPAVAAWDNQDQFLVVLQADGVRGPGNRLRACVLSGVGGVAGSFDLRWTDGPRGQLAVVCGTGSDQYMAVWADGALGENSDIVAQRVRSDRTLVGSLILLCVARKGQERPGVAYNSQRDEYLVAWRDFRSGQDYDLYARRLSATGERLGQELVIATTGRLADVPVVAYNPQHNEYLVVWKEFRTFQWGTANHVSAQRVSATGQPVGLAIWVSRDSAGAAGGRATVAFDRASGEYLVAWQARRENDSCDIYVQRLSGEGMLLGNALVLSGPGCQAWPCLAYNPRQNEYLVVWTEYDGDNELRGRRVSSAGTALGGELLLAGPESGEYGFDLACDVASGNYLLVWSAEGGGIFGQRLDGTGSHIGNLLTISAMGSEEMYPAVCYNSRAGEYTVVWKEYHDDTGDDLYGGQVSVAGSPLGDKAAVNAELETQRRQALAANNTNGEMLIVWQDFRNDSWDIYGQRWVSPSVSTTPMATPSATPARTVTPTPTGAGATSVFLPLLLRGS